MSNPDKPIDAWLDGVLDEEECRELNRVDRGIPGER